MKKRFILSVTSLLLLCKLAVAEEAQPPTLDSGLSIGGYSSLSIKAPRDSATELALDNLSLIAHWEGESRLKFFSELELEHPFIWNKDDHSTKKEANFDLERLYLDYNLSEKLNLRAGRFLTPAGNWNLLHAAPLVWTSTRPLVTSRLFPSSTNGLMLYGSVPMQNSAFEYTFFAETLKDQVHDDDEIRFRDVGGARFTFNNQMNLGLTLLTLREIDPHSPSYRLVGLDFLHKFNDLELSGEAYYRFTDSGQNGGGGAYLQSAYLLGNKWYALTRLETFQSPRDGSAERWLIGATKRLTPKQLLKMEFVGGTGGIPDEPRGFITSYSVLF
jgi:hypothetical protein